MHSRPSADFSKSHAAQRRLPGRHRHRHQQRAQGGILTTSSYDANNNLIAVTDATKAANNRSFVNDVAGRVLYGNQGGNVQRQLVVNGEVLGRYGTMLNPDKPADSSGSYPAANPSTHTVAAGETPASIAKSVFGDSTLWYLIADANGLSGDRDLRVDSDVLVWLKSQGKGYQTRLNVILREAMLKEVTKP